MRTRARMRMRGIAGPSSTTDVFLRLATYMGECDVDVM